LPNKVMREAVWINETTFWAPGTAAAGSGGAAALTRVARVQDVPDGISEMPHVLINQARVHDMFLDRMRNAPTRLVPDLGLKVAGLTVDPATDDHPVTVTLKPTPRQTAKARPTPCARTT
jgi:phenol 2-monooxygenase